MELFSRSTLAVTKTSEEELVVLHTGTGNYYTLNETGRNIWKYCSEPKSLDEIVSYIASDYEIPVHQAQRDVLPYIQFLCLENLFEKKTLI